jgi:glycosyltransferase involved in cell wall biosynthesis
MVSIIIPARNEKYLQKTVTDILSKGRNIQVIVVLDGYWDTLQDDERLVILHNTNSYGMRQAINDAVEIAKGEYLCKFDAHCMVSDGFDEVLVRDYEEGSLLVPTRYSLDADKWVCGDNAVEYLYLTYPYKQDEQFGFGLHGRKWMTRADRGHSSFYGLEIERKDTKVDEIVTFQGSCWFMKKQLFFDIGKLDEKYSFHYQESQELCFKVWLFGGRCLVDKNVWYAHYHKNEGSGYGLSKSKKYETEQFSTWFWMTNQWKKRKHDVEWLIDKFMPMPDWEDDWKDKRQDHTPKVLNEQGHDGFK